MRISSDIRPQPLPSRKAESASSNPKEGALVIIDSFQSQQAHGFLVEGAAASLGSTGVVHRYHHHQNVDGRATLPHVVAVKNLQNSFTAAPLSPESAKAGLAGFVSEAVAGNLNWATALLGQVTAEGFRHSVVNYSQGLDSIVLMVLAKHALSQGSKLTETAKQNYRENLTRATSGEIDPNIGEAELDKKLLQSIKSAQSESPSIQEATIRWRDQIQEFEKNNNSVVVAAGNSGRDIKALKSAGFDIDGSEDLNIFSVPGATVVGATIPAADSSVALASQSSFGTEIDFLAGGDFGEHFGTSFAGPKVANAMRAAHLANPDFSSEQAEEWVKNELSDSGEVLQHRVAILDNSRVSSLLRIID